jgi:RHS repeat-associated protein
MKTKFLLFVSILITFGELGRGSDLNISIFNDNSCDKFISTYYKRTIFCHSLNPSTQWENLNTYRVPAGAWFNYYAHGDDAECGVILRVTFSGSGNDETDLLPANDSTSQYSAILGGDPTQCTSTFDHQDPGDGDPNDNGANGDGPHYPDWSDDSDWSDNSSCGMPRWWVSEPYVSLHFRDEPLGYQPVQGARVSFKLQFTQREFKTGVYPNLFSVGKRWNFAWNSFITTSNASIFTAVHLSDGKEITFHGNSVDYLTNTKITGATNSGFTISYPDGSRDVYGFIVTNSTGFFLQAYRTEHWNPQSQKTLFVYDTYTPSDSPVIRLLYVVDGDGRTNYIYYVNSNSYSTNLIDHVVDAFGRTTYLGYDNSGHLTNIVDVAGITNSFAYVGDAITTLTTPYGNTSFQTTTATNSRSVLVIQPDGGKHLYLYQDSTPVLPSSYAGDQIPVCGAFSTTFDTNNLNLHNSFHWGPRQYAVLSNTNISSFNTNDFFRARMKHWLSSEFRSPGDTLSMERAPSPDSGGTIEGQKTWYDYLGKTNNAYEGTQFRPLFVAQVLPEGTTKFSRLMRNDIGAVTNEISTYSISSGSTTLLRTNIYVYDSFGIDLLAVTNALGVLASSNVYNASHEITNNFTPLGKTIYTYDANNRFTSSTSPSGLVTTNIYDGNGFLQQQIVLGFSTNTYTYASGLVATHTDTRNLTTTNAWDALQRLRRVGFPDGTFITNVYQNLDLVQVVDRMGFTNSYVFDSMRRLTNASDALGRHTVYNYCSCGALDSILDAAGNLTSFNRDNLGRATNILYADGYGVTSQFDLVGRMTNTIDSAGASVTNWFNNEGLLVAVTNAFGRVQTMAYDVLDRVTNAVDANGVGINTTYDSLNRVLTRAYPDGGTELFGYTTNVRGMTTYTNQLQKGSFYGYDSAGRKISETNANSEVTLFGYSGPGDLLTLTDGKTQTTSWNYDQFGRVTNKVDASANVIFVYSYDADDRLTNRWTPVTSNTVYSYDSVGNLATVRYQRTTNTFTYDAMDRLTNMVDLVGVTAYSYDAAGQLLSEDGPWDSDKVNYTYQNRLRMALSLPAPNASPWTQTYGYDAARRLTNVTSQAGSFTYFLGGSGFASPLVKKLLFPNSAYFTNYYGVNARLLGTHLRNSSGGALDTDDYVYNAGNQRTQQVFTAGNYVNYAYDNIGQLKTALGQEPSGATNRMQEQFGYVYDAAGNLNYRTNNTLIQTFSVNSLNELTTVASSGNLTVAGSTTGPATNVTVNTSNAILYVDNTFASTNQPWIASTNIFTAIAKDSYGRIDTNTVTARLAFNCNADYDLNGNLLRDRYLFGATNRVFAYDDENQLVAVWVTNTWKSEFSYDGRMRRRTQTNYTWSGSSWLPTNAIHYIYDGNLVIQERDGSNLPQVTYTRGNDLSGNLQGVGGGIGGLLARTDAGLAIAGSAFATAFYHADGNGNITCLIYTNQTIAAKYKYDPFGCILSQSGPLADANLYRFSSKEFHFASGLIDYLYRFYDSGLQRWINRDPIGEQGGNNLYEFVGNEPVAHLDELGLLYYYYSPGTLLEPAGPVPYLGSDTWYGQLGAEVYNVIPVLNNLIAGPLSQIGTAEGTVAGQGGSIAQVSVASIPDAVVVGSIVLPVLTTCKMASSIELGSASQWDTSLTKSGSRYLNVGTDVTASDFEKNLIDNGYIVVKRTTGSNGPVLILTNGSRTYTIYTASSTGAASAQVTGVAGNILVKIRLK